MLLIINNLFLNAARDWSPYRTGETLKTGKFSHLRRLKYLFR